jgi:hypothetical protein
MPQLAAEQEQHAMSRDGGGESREVERLVTIPRGRNGDELRISVDEFLPADGGEPKMYISIRVWWRADDGQMRPGKVGCTVRRAELARSIDALQRGEDIVENPGARRNSKPNGNAMADAAAEGEMPF